VIVPFTLSGSAENGASKDYFISTNTVTIPVGWTQGIILVQILDDDIDENDEQVVITLGAVTNGTLGSPSVHTILISDDDSPPHVNFVNSAKSVSEDAGPFSISVELSAPSVNDVSVPLLLSGSAGQGSDYSISSTNLVIPAGSLDAQFDISMIDDLQYDPDEKIYIDLGNPTNAVLGSPNRFTVSIEENDLSPCDVGPHLLTIGSDSIALSIVNEGEAVTFTGGSITWPKATGNNPSLTLISFAGSNVFTGSENPTFYAYSAWEGFSSLGTEVVNYQFDSVLGSGDHILVLDFQNLSSGDTCSLTEVYTNP
jgi:hypothetical protein